MNDMNQLTGTIIGKTVEAFTDVHTAQILTYMMLGKFNIGLLINFNVCSLRNGGIKRFVI